MSRGNVEKMPDDFDLLKTIRSEKMYKSNVGRRDVSARKQIYEHCKNIRRTPMDKIVLGQMLMFDYMEPKTKEDLEYYDAMPCTLFLGVRQTDKGPRVIGFNIHYYPPRMRYRIVNYLFTMYRDAYKKAWNKGLKEDLSGFEYEQFLAQLKKAKLEFGIRMYIPTLIQNIRIVPFKYWSKAVFTEGIFKKVTRMAIMNYWRQLKEKNYF